MKTAVIVLIALFAQGESNAVKLSHHDHKHHKHHQQVAESWNVGGSKISSDRFQDRTQREPASKSASHQEESTKDMKEEATEQEELKEAEHQVRLNNRNQHDGFIHNADGSKEDAETREVVGGVNNYHQQGNNADADDDDEGMGMEEQEEIAQAKIQARMKGRNQFDGLIHNKDGSKEEADTYKKVNGVNDFAQKKKKEDPPADATPAAAEPAAAPTPAKAPAEDKSKDTSAEEADQAETNAKKAEKIDKEVKVKDEAKWENKRWEVTWPDGLRHTKDGKRFNDDDNTEIKGVNNRAQWMTGKHQEIDVETFSEKTARQEEVQRAAKLNEKHEQEKERVRKQQLLYEQQHPDQAQPKPQGILMADGLYHLLNGKVTDESGQEVSGANNGY